jgi:Domain of unknown function (DUF222)/HNH endonuclease
MAASEVISMCDPQDPVSVPDALAMLDRALTALTAADAGSLPTTVQADALRALERAEARHTVARARILAAFTAQDGHEDDGQGSARTWLRWQTRVTRGAAAATAAWVRRLTAHPVIAQALAAGDLSTSWARELCAWSDRLPSGQRESADEILVAAARGGAEIPDLAGLAEEMYQRSRSPDDDPDDGFDDRALWLGQTLGGAGRLNGDLTPGCAAALSAVLESLGRKAGPEDDRSATQRRHDALEEACRRLIGSGMLPGRAGQPTQAQVHITLAQLRGMPGAADAEAAWRAAAAREHGWLTCPEADAAACDSTLAPIVTGYVDPAALDRMVEMFMASHGGAPLPAGTVGRLRGSLLAMAADVLSGPGGLASWLRLSLLGGGPAAAPSLPPDIPAPLDIGAAQPAIPAHLRRAVTARHPCCAFPGCDLPASLCQVHHLIPRSEGGPTALHNLAPLCAFHHLTVIHRWGWVLRLHPDGRTIASAPDGRTLHSHGPPSQAA